MTSAADEQQSEDQQKTDDSHNEEAPKVIATKVTGTVKWFNVRNGYGFINRNDTKEDVFVHQTAIKRNNPRKYLRSVGDDETVEFDVIEGQKGLEAANVTGPDGEPVVGSKYAPDRRPRYRRNYDGEDGEGEGGGRGRGRGGYRGRGRGRGGYRGGYRQRRSSGTAEERSDQDERGDRVDDQRPRRGGSRGRGRGRGGYRRNDGGGYRRRNPSDGSGNERDYQDGDREGGSRPPRSYRRRPRRNPQRSSDEEHHEGNDRRDNRRGGERRDDRSNEQRDGDDGDRPPRRQRPRRFRPRVPRKDRAPKDGEGGEGGDQHHDGGDMKKDNVEHSAPAPVEA